MKGYLYYALMTLKRRIAYRADLFIGYLLAVITMIIFKLFWVALAKAGKIPEQDLQVYICYAMIMAIMGSLFSSNLIRSISDMIRSGQIASIFQKPLDIQMYGFSIGLGELTGGIVFDFLPKLIILKFVLNVQIPGSFTDMLFFAVSLFLAYFLLVSIDYMISMLAFYFVETWAFELIKNFCVGVLSGLYFPLWLYPEKVIAIINVLPFKFIYFTPAEIFLGRLSMNEIFHALAMQILWLAGLVVTGRMVALFAMRKLTVAGG